MQDGQRNIKFAHDPSGLISQSNITLRLIGKSTDEACPKTTARWLPDRRAALLGPCQLECAAFAYSWPQRLDWIEMDGAAGGEVTEYDVNQAREAERDEDDDRVDEQRHLQSEPAFFIRGPQSGNTRMRRQCGRPAVEARPPTWRTAIN